MYRLFHVGHILHLSCMSFAAEQLLGRSYSEGHCNSCLQALQANMLWESGQSDKGALALWLLYCILPGAYCCWQGSVAGEQQRVGCALHMTLVGVLIGS